MNKKALWLGISALLVYATVFTSEHVSGRLDCSWWWLLAPIPAAAVATVVLITLVILTFGLLFVACVFLDLLFGRRKKPRKESDHDR